MPAGCANCSSTGKVDAVLDHLVLAGPDLAEAVASFTARTGVQPARGGSHVGLGTANYLVGLGDGAYLEIIGPDDDQPAPAQPRPFGIDELDAPRIVTWAMRTDDLDRLISEARDAGYDVGDPVAMSRRTPDGELLEWRLAFPPPRYGDGLVPFLIDWGTSAHPTSRDLPASQLLEWHATHPDPASVRPALAALRADLRIEIADHVSLTALVRGAHGPVPL
jgi:Glyoxalase-like domain